MRAPGRRPLIGLALAVLWVAPAGCADKLAQRAAREAGHQVGYLQADVARKIDAENDYYEGIVALSAEDLDRTSRILLQDRLTRASRQFVAQNEGAAPDAKLAEALRSYMKGFVADSRKVEAEQKKVYEGTQTRLREGRAKLELESAKIAQLRSKLQALGEARSWRGMFEFLIGFGKETQKAVDRIEEGGGS